ncbi:MAG: SUMF1/EgtB/PvdO family nonheme iron enzyme [Candidatus Nealsonbacteria bacterium]|nr:SUMF1/EgtB/PvdO family nonheme iron enzyme [Candidatus Nealsonbacteria bacterium]
MSLSYPEIGNMIALARWSLLAVGLFSSSVAFAHEPVLPVTDPPPGVVIDRSSDPAQVYIGCPGIAVLPGGDYVASHSWFGLGTTNSRMTVFGSTDQGKTWKHRGDAPTTNSIGMKLAPIAPGNFTMGSVSGGDFDERPVHKVTISEPFLIGTTEVTNAQYERFDPDHKKLRGKLGFSKEDDDAVPGGAGGTAVLVSRDDGETWTDPGKGRPQPTFEPGKSGAWIAGIHAGFVQLIDGRLMAFGRGNNIDGRMPISLSADLGRNWAYHPSPFPGIGGGQRLVILRLQQGPILFCSFGKNVKITDASGHQREVSGLFAAISTDEGKTWSIKRPITDDGPPRTVDGGGNTGKFTLSRTSAEPRGYMSICQTPDGLIHLISSKQHYAFNLAWLNAPAPAP